MSVSTLHLYKVFKHAIDYSNVWSGTFETMKKTYLGKVDLNYYVPLSDEFDITLNSELLRTTTNKNLFNIYNSYGSTGVFKEKSVINNQLIIETDTLPANPYASVHYYINNLTIGENYTFSSKATIEIGVDTGPDFYIRLQFCDINKTGIGDVFSININTNLTLNATQSQIIIWVVQRNNTSTQQNTRCRYYDIQFEKNNVATEYTPYFATPSTNVFNEVNYAVIENEDETRHYFVKDKKQRLTKGTRQFSLSVDEWFDKGLNNGLDVLQRVGHPDTNFPVFGVAYDYIVKPSYLGNIKNQSTLYQSTTYPNACVIVIIYQTPTTFITAIKGYSAIVPSTIMSDFRNLCLATKIKQNGIAVDVTPIKAYIVPGAFFGTSNYTGGFNLDFYVNGSYTGFENFAWKQGVQNYQSQISTRTFYTSGNWGSQDYLGYIAGGYPIREVIGVMGQTYNIDSPVIRPLGTTSLSISLNLSIGFSDITASFKSEFTDNKYEDITSAFEEIVSYSEYQQFVNTNRSSLAVQRGINLFNVGAGVLSIATGQGGAGLVSAVSGIATTESSVQDKKYKKSITTGNQGGLTNLVTAYAYGLNGFCAYYEKCQNSESVLNAIKNYGYKFDGIMTNTLNRASTSFESQFAFSSSISAPSDLSYNRYYRYIAGDIVCSKLIPEQIITAFKKGVYVHYAVATS
jgi:hypothetical protein